MNLPVRTLAVAGLALGAAAAEAAANSWRNVTAGGPLRPGVYGRIEVRNGPPPAVVHAAPVVAHGRAAPGTQPVYLYVPPGQVRRWSRDCAKWQACDRPVYFVRVDDSPSRLGAWKRSTPARPAVAFALNDLGRPAAR
jgi:hypothetical protein